MANNSVHDPEFDLKTAGGNEYVPARVMYERAQGQPRMVDDCDGHAIFQSTVLEANGWDAYMIGLSIEGPIGHNVTGVNLPDGRILVIDNAGKIEGYFDSLASVARHYIQKGWCWLPSSWCILHAITLGKLEIKKLYPSTRLLLFITKQPYEHIFEKQQYLHSHSGHLGDFSSLISFSISFSFAGLIRL